MYIFNIVQYLQYEQAGLKEKYNQMLYIVSELIKTLKNE